MRVTTTTTAASKDTIAAGGGSAAPSLKPTLSGAATRPGTADTAASHQLSLPGVRCTAADPQPSRTLRPWEEWLWAGGSDQAQPPQPQSSLHLSVPPPEDVMNRFPELSSNISSRNCLSENALPIVGDGCANVTNLGGPGSNMRPSDSSSSSAAGLPLLDNSQALPPTAVSNAHWLPGGGARTAAAYGSAAAAAPGFNSPSSSTFFSKGCDEASETLRQLLACFQNEYGSAAAAEGDASSGFSRPATSGAACGAATAAQTASNVSLPPHDPATAAPSYSGLGAATAPADPAVDNSEALLQSLLRSFTLDGGLSEDAQQQHFGGTEQSLGEQSDKWRKPMAQKQQQQQQSDQAGREKGRCEDRKYFDSTTTTSRQTEHAATTQTKASLAATYGPRVSGGGAKRSTAGTNGKPQHSSEGVPRNPMPVRHQNAAAETRSGQDDSSMATQLRISYAQQHAYRQQQAMTAQLSPSTGGPLFGNYYGHPAQYNQREGAFPPTTAAAATAVAAPADWCQELWDGGGGGASTGGGGDSHPYSHHHRQMNSAASAAAAALASQYYANNLQQQQLRPQQRSYPHSDKLRQQQQRDQLPRDPAILSQGTASNSSRATARRGGDEYPPPMMRMPHAAAYGFLEGEQAAAAVGGGCFEFLDGNIAGMTATATTPSAVGTAGSPLESVGCARSSGSAAALRTGAATGYSDDRDRMAYVSWIPKKARAYNAVDKRPMELDLKRRLRETMGLTGLIKVLLFPPKGVHCKLIFDSRASAAHFMARYGGENRSVETEQWKIDLCNAFNIELSERFANTVVKIEWSQK